MSSTLNGIDLGALQNENGDLSAVLTVQSLPHQAYDQTAVRDRLSAVYTLAITGTKISNDITGCGVSQATPAGMGVELAAGTINANAIGGASSVAVGGTSLAIDASSPTLNRIDVIRISSTGTPSVQKGTAATSPVPPTVLSGYYEIARVYVAAGATSITNSNITDRRAFAPAAGFIKSLSNLQTGSQTGYTFFCDFLTVSFNVKVKRFVWDYREATPEKVDYTLMLVVARS